MISPWIISLLSTLLCAFCWCLAVSADPLQQPSTQKRPVLPAFITPEWLEARLQVIEDNNTQKLAELHSLNGDKTSLVRQLQQNMAFYLSSRHDSKKAVPLAEEWLKVYPQLPDVDKRWLASQALYIAKRLHGGAEVQLTAKDSRASYPDTATVRAQLATSKKMVAYVVQAAKSGNWLIDKWTKERLMDVALDESFDEETRAAAKEASEIPGTTIGSSALSLVEELEAAVSAKDTSEKTRKCLSELTKLYPNLSKSEQHALAERIVSADVNLLPTPVFDDADTLLWTVQKSVESGQLMTSGKMEADFGRAHYFYLKSKNDYASAEKLLRTIVSLREYHGGDYGVANARLMLGYLLKKMGRMDEASEQFDKALESAKKAADNPLTKTLPNPGNHGQISSVERARRFLQNPTQNDYYRDLAGTANVLNPPFP